MAEQLRSSQSKRPPAIWHPLLDFLCVGGASIIAGIVMMCWFSDNPDWIGEFERFSGTRNLDDVHLFWMLTLLINYPHFMASYRLLYRSKKLIQTHRWSSIWIPLLLLLACLSAVLFLETPVGNVENPQMELGRIGAGGWTYSAIVYCALSSFSVVYLGWHYNLQGWGMTASFAFMHGIRFADNERRLIKSGFLAMVATHGILFLAWSPLMMNASLKELLVQLTLWLPALGGLSLILGGLGFAKAYQRTGKRIPINAITPWITSVFWYYMVMNYHSVFGIAVTLQIAHALQYLSFTTRVERNLLPRKVGISGIIKWLAIMAGLVFCGWLVFVMPGELESRIGPKLHYLFALQLLVVAINIHHFFVDGTIWKISNPEVRRTLFAHLEPT